MGTTVRKLYLAAEQADILVLTRHHVAKLKWLNFCPRSLRNKDKNCLIFKETISSVTAGSDCQVCFGSVNMISFALKWVLKNTSRVFFPMLKWPYDKN